MAFHPKRLWKHHQPVKMNFLLTMPQSISKYNTLDFKTEPNEL